MSTKIKLKNFPKSLLAKLLKADENMSIKKKNSFTQILVKGFTQK